MEEKIKSFFESPGKEAMEHLGSGAKIRMTIGETSYVLKVTDGRDVIVGKDGQEDCDVEIVGEQEVMDDLFSSSSRHEFSGKMKLYIRDRKAPKGKILMERTLKNVKKFYRIYHFFLVKFDLLK